VKQVFERRYEERGEVEATYLKKKQCRLYI